MFDTSFVASEVDADRLEQGTGGKRPLVVPNAVDTDYFHNPATDRPFDNILVFTGHMGNHQTSTPRHTLLERSYPPFGIKYQMCG